MLKISIIWYLRGKVYNSFFVLILIQPRLLALLTILVHLSLQTQCSKMPEAGCFIREHLYKKTSLLDWV